MNSSFSFLLLITLITFHSIYAQETVKPFSAAEYLEGEWVITKSSFTPHASTLDHADWTTHYIIEKENNTNHLIGRVYENDTTTGDIGNENLVHIEFTSITSGVWRIGNDEDSMNIQFKFEFLPLANDLQISAGEWLGGDAQGPRLFDDDDEPKQVPDTKKTPAFYMMQLANWDKFIITVFKLDEFTGKQQILTLYQAKKIPVVNQQTWFQRNQTLIMLGCFFVFQMWIKSRAAARETAAPTAAELAQDSKTPASTKKNK